MIKWSILFKLSNRFHSDPNDCFSHFSKKQIKKIFLIFPSVFEISREPELLSIYLTMRLQREGLIGLKCKDNTQRQITSKMWCCFFFPQKINLLHHSAKIAPFSHGSFSQGLASQCLKHLCRTTMSSVLFNYWITLVVLDFYRKLGKNYLWAYFLPF